MLGAIQSFSILIYSFQRLNRQIYLTGVTDNLDFLLVYRSTDELSNASTTPKIFEYFAHKFDTQEAHTESGDTNMEDAGGSSLDVSYNFLSNSTKNEKRSDHDIYNIIMLHVIKQHYNKLIDLKVKGSAELIF